jgi:hypothetical protein
VEVDTDSADRVERGHNSVANVESPVTRNHIRNFDDCLVVLTLYSERPQKQQDLRGR